MLTALAIVAASLVGGAAGCHIVYRIFVPKMEEGIRQSLLDTHLQWERITDKWLRESFAKNEGHIADEFAGYRLDARIDRQHDKTEMLKLLLDAVEKHSKLMDVETQAQVAKLAQGLQEQVDALTQDAAEAIDGGLDSRIANIVREAMATKPAEAKMDGVSTDKPDEEAEEEKRQATGGRFHM